MRNYQRLDNNVTEQVFENPFENNELDDLDPETTRQRESARLLSSFIVNGEQSYDDDDDDSEDEIFVDSGDISTDSNENINQLSSGNIRDADDSNIDNRIASDDTGQSSITDSLFNSSNHVGSANVIGDFATLFQQNSQNRLTVSQRVYNTIDRLTSNTPGRKVLHHFFPNYISSASSNSPYHGQVVGNGLQNDGVFSNMMAKPTIAVEDEANDIPPSYDEAAADAVPLYWESTVFSQYGEGVYVDGLPVGNIINFLWNLIVSSTFQFVGFLLTYLLHTSHAAKEGSRAGLGITFISYGYYMIPDDHWTSLKKIGGSSGIYGGTAKFEPADPNNFDVDSNLVLEGSIDDYTSSIDNVDGSSSNNGGSNGSGNNNDASASAFDENNAPIFAYGLVALGVFVCIKSLLDYYRAKQMEKVILQSPANVYEVSPEGEEVVDENEAPPPPGEV